MSEQLPLDGGRVAASLENPTKKLWRITPEQLRKLPDGTVLRSLTGQTLRLGIDTVDRSAAEGRFLSFGFFEEDKPSEFSFEEKACVEITPVQEEPVSEDEDRKGIWCITPELFETLPNGTLLMSVLGHEIIKGRDHVSMDAHGGYLGVGFLKSQRPKGMSFDPRAFYPIDLSQKK